MSFVLSLIGNQGLNIPEVLTAYQSPVTSDKSYLSLSVTVNKSVG
jgi:hypothetical protein